MTRWWMLGVVPALLSLLCCAVDQEVGPLRKHPIDDLIVRTGTGGFGELQRGGYAPPASLDFAAQLAAATEIARVGEDSGAEEYIFGEIVDADIGPDGRLYALDARFGQLRVFALDGEWIETVGRPGQGPAEFMEPTSLLVSQDEIVYVGDRGRRIHLFSPTPAGLEIRHAAPLSFPPRSICNLGEQLVVHGLFFRTDLEPLHLLRARLELSPDNVVHSFGRTYESSSALIDWKLGQGLMACDNTRVIHAVASGLGEIRAYSHSGEHVWTRRISGYIPIDLWEREGGGRRMRVPEGGFDVIEGLVTLDNEYVLIQVSRYELQPERYPGDSPTERSRVDSYLVSTVDGQGGFVGDSLPLIRRVRGEHLIETTEGMTPQVIVKKWR